MLSNLWQDVAYAFRVLRKSPGFTAVALVTLALGIGANSAIFSVVNGVLLEPLPYASSDRLVYIYSQFPTMDFDEFWVSPPEYRELQQRSRSYSSIGAWRTSQVSIAGSEAPVRVTAATVTAEFFTTLGVSPMLGRPFTPEEDRDAADVVVISQGLWQRSFGADPDIVGGTAQVNGRTATVTGVMPEGFDIEDAGVDVWAPSGIPEAPTNRASHWLRLVARLAPDVSLPQARSELNSLVATWADLVPDAHVPNPEGHPFGLHSLQEEMVGGVRNALVILLASVGLVLLIAVANVGNLLLAKSEGRRREVAVRMAMGAGRNRLVAQFLTESVILAVIGGVLGLALGWAGLKVMLAVSPGSIPRIGEIELSGTVILFTMGISLLAGLLFGLAPLLHVSTDRVGAGLKEGGRQGTAGVGRQRLRKGFVVAEVALAVMLVVGAGLLIRSLAALQRVDPGFDPNGLVTFQLYLPAAGYGDASAAGSFYASLLERLKALPGVTQAAAMSGLPPLRDLNANDTEFEGVERTPDRPYNVDYYQTVQGDYLETMGISVVDGRGFQPGDDGQATPVVLINETLARIYYPDQSPLGRRIQPAGAPFWMTIVGVVEDVKQGGLAEDTGTELYFHNPQVAAAGVPQRTMNIVVRTDRELGVIAGDVRRVVAALDPTVPLANLQTMGENLASVTSRPRFLTFLLGIFAVLALVLAAVGTYGVMSYAVAERAHEIGIRMAMGAERRSVLGLIMGGGLGLAGMGLVLGLAGAFSVSRVMQSLLFGVTASDVTTYLAAPLVLAVVAVAACFVPAWRAARTDPARVLREE